MATGRFRLMLARAAFVAAVVVGLLALAADAYRRFPGLLARHAAETLDSAPDEEIDSILRETVALGDEGLTVLVDALDSDREVLAARAKAVLWEDIERWENLPPQDGARRAGVLASLLADRAERFRPPARQHAGALAGELLRRSSSGVLAQAAGMVAACETVVRQAIVDGETRETPPVALPVPESPKPKKDAKETAEVAFPTFRPLPAGGLPLDTAPLPAEAPRTSQLPRPIEEGEQPTALANQKAALPK
jgi:hypothetical protein